LEKGDLATANRTFNTSLFASIVLAIGLLPVAGALSWFAPSFLNIPEGEEMGTRFLLMCTSFAFLLNAVGSNFACSTFAKNRFDVQRIVDALGFITQIGVVVALFTGLAPNLWYVGLGVAGSAIVRQACYQVSWRKLTPELGIHRTAFDRSRLREILGMGGWLTVEGAGWVLLRSFDLVIVNTLIGVSAAGWYAAVTQWYTPLSALSGVVSAVVTPTLVASYAIDDADRVARVSRRVGTALGLAMALPLGLVMGFSGPVLVLWRGDVPHGMGAVMCVVLAPLCLLCATGPVLKVCESANRVRVPGLARVVLGGASVCIAWALVRHAGLGTMAVAVVGACALVVRNVGVYGAYAARLVSKPVTHYWASAAAAAGMTAAVGGLALLAQAVLGDVHSWGVLVCASSVVTAAYVAVCSLFLPLRRALGLTRHMPMRRVA